MFPHNNDRIDRQQKLAIRVIIGNPPYSVGQDSAPTTTTRTSSTRPSTSNRDTYADRSTATNKNSLYDSYIRAIRWATDRIERRAASSPSSPTAAGSTPTPPTASA